MKKLISVILAAVMLLSMSAVSLAADKDYPQSFWDLPKDHWAFDEVAELVERGVIAGYDDGSFKPDNTVTRAEWAKIMVLAAGVQATDSSVRFSDMNGHWANPYVNAASQYLASYADGSFRPDQAAVREDVTVSLVKLKGYDVDDVDYSYLNSFTDVNSISNDLKRYVAVAVEKGLISGFEDNTFRGQATLTRAEAATLLWRAFQYGNDDKVTVTAAPTAAPQITQTYLPTAEPTAVPAGGSVSEPVRTQSPTTAPTEQTSEPTSEPTPESTLEPTPTPKPYYIDTVKRVDIIDDYHDYYSVGGGDIYYVSADNEIMKLNIATGEEEMLVNINDEIERMAAEDDPNSAEDNIYLDGGRVNQVFYDTYRSRVIVCISFNASGSGNYMIQNGQLQEIMPERRGVRSLMVSLPDNKIMTADSIIDAETGEEISSFESLETETWGYGDVLGAYYDDGKVYYEILPTNSNISIFKSYDFLNRETIIGSAKSAAYSNGVCYALFNDIGIYNTSGAKKDSIAFSDIEIRDMVPNIEGQLICSDTGELLLFNGNTFRIIKKNG